MGILFFLIGIGTQIFAPDLLVLQEVMTSDGSFDSLALHALSGMSLGLFIAGSVLIALSFLFRLIESGRIRVLLLSEKKFLMGLLGLQLLLGIIYLFCFTYQPSGDSVWYLKQAANIAAGRGVVTPEGNPTAFWPVGYSFFLGFLYKIFGVHTGVAQAANLFFLLGMTLFSYLIVKRLFNQSMAQKVALVMALMPSQTFYVLIALADTPFALLTLVLIYLAIQRPSYLNTIISGILLGFALHLRAVILFFPIVLALFRYLQTRKLKPALVQLVFVMLLGEMILLPWQIRNYRVFDEFVFSGTYAGFNLWMGNNPNARGGVINQSDYYCKQQALSYIAEHPFRTILLWPGKLIHLYYKDSKCITYGFKWSYENLSPPLLMSLIAVTEGYYYALGLSFLIGLIPFIKREKFLGRGFIIFGTLLYFSLCYLPFTGDGRYHMPLLPLFAVVALYPRKTPQQPPDSAPVIAD
jgi:4-amino-4-deoxy-L-arabinose transferase-like glycosyltransferase